MKKYIAIKEIKPSSRMMKYWNGLADSEVEGARLDLPQMLIRGQWYTWEDGDRKSVIVYDRKGKEFEFDYDDVEQIKESTSAWEKSLKQAIELDKMKMLSKKDKATLQRIAKLLKKEKENEANEGFSKNLIKYAIGLAEKHAGNMTKDEAITLMTQEGFQEESEAEGKWVRAQLTSCQLSTYFIGTMEMWRLRRDMENRLGKRFNLKNYHEEYLLWKLAMKLIQD